MQLYKRHLLLRSFAHLGAIVFLFVVFLDFRGSRVKFYWHIISEPDTAGTRGKKKYTQQLSGVYIGKADASYILNDIYESTHKYFMTRS